MSLYQTLGVRPEASADEIKAAYRRLAQLLHPDKAETGDADAFSALSKAYAVLSDPEKRRCYDETGDEDQRESMPMKILAERLINLVSNFDVDSKDLLEVIRTDINAELVKGRAAVKEGHNSIAKHERAAARLSRRNGGENFLAAVLESQIRNLRKGIGSIEAQIKIWEQASEILGEYECAPAVVTNLPSFGWHSPLR